MVNKNLELVQFLIEIYPSTIIGFLKMHLINLEPGQAVNWTVVQM